MANLINCGFAREVVLSGTTTYKSKVFERILEDFHDRFGDLPNYFTTKSPLKVKFKAYAKFIHKKKVAVSVKQQIRDAFSGEKWRELTREQKEAHTLKDCQVRKPYLSFKFLFGFDHSLFSISTFGLSSPLSSSPVKTITPRGTPR